MVESQNFSCLSVFQLRSGLGFYCFVFLFFQDMWFYLSEHEKFNDFGNEGALIWHETNIPYAVWKPESTRTLSMTYYPSEVVEIWVFFHLLPSRLIYLLH